MIYIAFYITFNIRDILVILFFYLLIFLICHITKFNHKLSQISLSNLL